MPAQSLCLADIPIIAGNYRRSFRCKCVARKALQDLRCQQVYEEKPKGTESNAVLIRAFLLEFNHFNAFQNVNRSPECCQPGGFADKRVVFNAGWKPALPGDNCVDLSSSKNCA